MSARRMLACCLYVAALSACSQATHEPLPSGIGGSPPLPAPEISLLPTVNAAKAVGWEAHEVPLAAAGFEVDAFARNLKHPRWMYVLPNGDVLVAETNAPHRPDDAKGIKGWIAGKVMARAGATVPSANRITLLRDANGDGKAEVQVTLIDKLSSPFGMALVGERLYVANSDAIVAYPYRDGDLRIDAPGVTLAALPAGTINHHWTKSLVASADGRTLFVGVGSNSNIAENGMDKETDRAAILAVDVASGRSRVFASGLRNPVGMAWQPQTGALWTVVNERDELGNDLVPDYLTSVRDGDFFGWPYSYFGAHLDPRVAPQRPDLVARARAPDYALGSHTAPLGLAFYDADHFPARYRSGAFVGQHGSWNREPRSGYQGVLVPFVNGEPSGVMEPVLTGFLDDDGQARGRPVGVVVDRSGALLVADDVGNIVWRLRAVRPEPGA
ncbi:MAG: sorbosone dehydrogenase family protein [Arenimonas sp.]|uniref:PQQ-dependent sugar dehydrogenase n=1 Tax=Arenimonas sp. TaxID=1872635 RepID=UPI0025C46F7E|nr:sorbosone dehydrogenase family protein [Arenimonas sp.]MBW8368828.1 sorbosone dehydrogenase family protein [Arenimonas sp.]